MPPQEGLQGYWQDLAEPDFKIGVEGSRLLISFGGRVREVDEILAVTGEHAKVCKIGREAKLGLQRKGDFLIFQDETRGKVRKLERLPQEPKGLSLSFSIPEPMPVPEVKMLHIQGEVYRREEAEQGSMRLRRRPSAESPLPWLGSRLSAEPEPLPTDREFLTAQRTTENTEFMRQLLAEVGWIDVPRFGYSASREAFLLVQHSWDVQLLTAALPRVKKDVDSGQMESDAYALLYDRLQLALGRPQRYGSQVVSDGQEGVVVLPVEDQSKIEELRKQLGLISLKEYVGVLGSPEVKLSKDCSGR